MRSVKRPDGKCTLGTGGRTFVCMSRFVLGCDVLLTSISICFSKLSAWPMRAEACRNCPARAVGFRSYVVAWLMFLLSSVVIVVNSSWYESKIDEAILLFAVVLDLTI
jgi:hypothetical protein